MSLSPTQRTLRELRQRGCHCGIVERFNRFVGPHGIRQDLFGIIDIIALYPNNVVGVQSCGSDFASHDRKILESDMSFEWLKSGGLLELWGWRKVKRRKQNGLYGKGEIWSPRMKDYKLEDFKC